MKIKTLSTKPTLRLSKPLMAGLRSSVYAGVALTLSLLSSATGHGASPDSLTWTEQISGNGNNLFSVSVLSNDFAVAVGSNATVLKYDGSSWAPFPGFADYAANSSAWGGAKDLRASAVPGSSAVYVGSYDSGVGRVGYWNGSSWATIQTGTGIRVTSMWSASPNLVLAGRINGIISKFDDAVFKGQVLNGTFGTTTVHKIAGSGANNIWATGPLSTESVLHSTNGGTTWAQVSTSISGANLNPLYSLSETQNWFHSGRNLFFYDGETFTLQHQFSSADNIIHGVYALSESQVWVVGHNLASYYDGTTWQDLGLGNNTWRSISGTGTDIWVVGDSGRIYAASIPEPSVALSLLAGGLTLAAIRRYRYRPTKI